MDLQYKARQVCDRLLVEYGKPEWRDPYPALDELVSTILSQNTNDLNRDRAFQSLKKRFTTWEEVRDANEGELIDTIRTAGLANQKGPRIQAVLREISRQRGELDLDFLSDLSSTEIIDWLTQFKGVGPKTAAIVAQFSLNKPAFPVDTHIYRVTGRLGLRPAGMSVEKAHPHLAGLFPPEEYYSAHLNLIRLGRQVCKARKPSCAICPVATLCDYFAGLQGQGDAGI